MPLPDDDLISILLAQLTPDEIDHGVVYVAMTPIAAEPRLELPRMAIAVPWEALLAFIDRDPMANWGHACRYSLINRESGEVQSFEAQFPPFHRDEERRWRVAYKAPSVPSAVLAAPW
jgi:hypothetical protein